MCKKFDRVFQKVQEGILLPGKSALKNTLHHLQVNQLEAKDPLDILIERETPEETVLTL